HRLRIDCGTRSRLPLYQRACRRPKGWGWSKGMASRGKALPEKAKRLLRPAHHQDVAMLSLFQRKRVPLANAAAPPPVEPANGLTRPQSATSLLAEPRRQRLLEHIWQRTSLSRRQFRSLYLAPLERYAELVQQFPASEAHHHAWPGGMLDHGLEIVAYAALLHDIGKIAVDLHVEQADGLVWHPWHGPLRQPYRFRYRTVREYRLHGAATGLLYTRVLDAGILDWLSDYQDLWSALLYVLAGQYEHAGTLGELVVKADQASVALALGGDPARAMAAPKHALQRKLLDGLRYLLREEFKLNQPGGPSDGWLTQDALWLVSKTVSDKLRAHLLSQGIEGIPSNTTAVFTVLQDHGIVQPAPDGKAIWRATVTSGTGWSHSFTFLRLSPALIWESGERPAPFAGTVTTEEPLPGDEAAPASAGIPATSPPPGVADSPAGIADPISDLLSMLDASDAATTSASSASAEPPSPSAAAPVAVAHLAP